MNNRRKRKNPVEKFQPQLKHPRSDPAVEYLQRDFDTREDRTKFLSTIFCLLSPHIWFKITHDDYENDSICNNLGIKSSLFYPLLRKVGLITTKHYQVTVNLKIS